MAATFPNRAGPLYLLVAIGLLTVGPAVARPAADEKPIELSKVPAKVMMAANKAVPKAKWMEATTSEEDGKVYYNLDGTDAKGRAVTVEVTAEGKVTEVVTEITEKEVPMVVMKALRAKLPKFAIAAVFEVRQEGKVVGYDFEGKRPKDKEEITVSITADGKKVEIDEGKE